MPASQDANGAYLYGLASKEQNPPEGETLWVYDSPVTLYAFPLKPGTSWTKTGTIKNGLVRGLPYAATDVYQGTDDATRQLMGRAAAQVPSCNTALVVGNGGIMSEQVALVMQGD